MLRTITALLAAALLSAPAIAQQLGPQVHAVETQVTIVVQWVTNSNELRDVAAQVGVEVEPGRMRGFSVLAQHDATGQWICMVFVFKPKRWDSPAVETLGHELLHCNGYQH